MLGDYDAVSFIATRNPPAARQFYEHALGLSFVAEEPFALVFDLHGRRLRIAKVEILAPARYTVLGWEVADIAATVEGLSARGVKFERFEGMPQDARGIWASPGGSRVAWFKDPDGNTLSLTEFETTTPSGSDRTAPE